LNIVLPDEAVSRRRAGGPPPSDDASNEEGLPPLAPMVFPLSPEPSVVTLPGGRIRVEAGSRRQQHVRKKEPDSPEEEAEGNDETASVSPTDLGRAGSVDAESWDNLLSGLSAGEFNSADDLSDVTFVVKEQLENAEGEIIDGARETRFQVI